ncbi:MAG: alanine racemase [Chloroflexi bacterium]|nr:alanine racemase [Chloroflexota bacterium]MBP8058357.1 alanine racemase [Chloroflexota bacterium]
MSNSYLPPLSLIEKPTLLLDKQKVWRNISRMVEKANRAGVRLRPHFKTHQSATIGSWFQAQGINDITVSSVDMAAYFAHHGWDDITLAFPVNWREIGKINQLAATIRLNLLVESRETGHFLSQNLTQPVSVWLKVDTGYGRTGIHWTEKEQVIRVAESIAAASHLTLTGLLTHTGHAYGPTTPAQATALFQETVTRLQTLRSALHQPDLRLSIGDTPTCTLVEDLSGIDEIRPGNFVFYDYMQVQHGVCSPDDVAIALACPVVARHPERQEIVLYGGAIHLSKEYLDLPNGHKHYGAIALPTSAGWSEPVPRAYVNRLSQEHGIVQADPAFIEQVHIGDILLVLPVHSCLTANLRQSYLTLEGETIPMAGIL